MWILDSPLEKEEMFCCNECANNLLIPNSGYRKRTKYSPPDDTTAMWTRMSMYGYRQYELREWFPAAQRTRYMVYEIKNRKKEDVASKRKKDAAPARKRKKPAGKSKKDAAPERAEPELGPSPGAAKKDAAPARKRKKPETRARAEPEPLTPLEEAMLRARAQPNTWIPVRGARRPGAIRAPPPGAE